MHDLDPVFGAFSRHPHLAALAKGLFKEPLLRMCDSEKELVEEVGITVVHEIAHHFGIDDDALHRLGWG